jgi:heme/copper-type cytochrome/quinol oxidase subunit 2
MFDERTRKIILILCCLITLGLFGLLVHLCIKHSKVSDDQDATKKEYRKSIGGTAVGIMVMIIVCVVLHKIKPVNDRPRIDPTIYSNEYQSRMRDIYMKNMNNNSKDF